MKRVALTIRSHFLKAMDQIAHWLFPYPAFSVDLSKSEKVWRISDPLLLKVECQYGYFSPVRPLAGRVSSSREDFHASALLLDYIATHITDPFLSFFSTGEILAKILAYRDLKEGDSIRVLKETYRVDHVFNLWRNMPAFGLICTTGHFPPLLLFRGTDPTFWTKRGFASIFSDLDHRGVGFGAFFHARQYIRSWLEKVGKARIVGFSLGGTLALYTAIYETAHVHSVIAFNPAGISEEVFHEWEKKRQEIQDISIFVTEGDFVAKKGFLLNKSLLCKVEKRLRPMEAHLALLSSHPLLRISELKR